MMNSKLCPADFEINADGETFPDQFRAARLARRRRKRKALPERALGRGVLIVPGADASANYVVAVLKAARIERAGLQIGRETPDDDMNWEPVTRRGKNSASAGSRTD